MAVFFAIILFIAIIIFWRMGRFLVCQDTYSHVKWAVVLSGQSRECERTDRALELFLHKKIDTLLLSSMRVFKNRYEAEFLMPYLMDEGYDSGKIFELRHDAHSTIEEASNLVSQLRLLNLDTVLIITSNFHTARAKKIFNRLSRGNPHFLVDAADHNYFKPESWWSSRESAKHLVFELLKTIFTTFELKFNPPPISSSSVEQLRILPKKPFLSSRIPQAIVSPDTSNSQKLNSDAR